MMPALIIMAVGAWAFACRLAGAPDVAGRKLATEAYMLAVLITAGLAVVEKFIS